MHQVRVFLAIAGCTHKKKAIQKNKHKKAECVSIRSPLIFFVTNIFLTRKYLLYSP